MKATKNYMPPDQFNQVLEAVPSLHIRKWKDKDIQMLFKLCYWCALRIGEAIRLKVEDFDLEIGKIYLGDTKSNLNDDTAIPSFFIPEVKQFLEGRSEFLFPGLTYGTCIKWIERLGEDLGIIAWTTPQSVSREKTKTHIFRKSIGKDQLNGTYGKKANLPTISKTLRHKGKNPLASTIAYLKADSQDVSDYWDEISKTQKET